MIPIRKGERRPLTYFFPNDNTHFFVDISVIGLTVEFVCIGLTERRTFAGSAYLIRSDQPRTSCATLELLSIHSHFATYSVDLAKRPETIHRFVFTAISNTSATLEQALESRIVLDSGRQPVAALTLTGADLLPGAVLILGEIYLHNEDWKFYARGECLSSLEALNKHYQCFDDAERIKRATPLPRQSHIVEQAMTCFSERMAPKLVDELAQVHVIGAFSAGKSRLVRELLRAHAAARPLLPISSQERQTALPLEITYGEEPLLQRVAVGCPEQAETLRQFPSRDEQLSFNPDAYKLRLELPEPNLLLGNIKLICDEEGSKRLVLKDMPGWNSGDSFVAEDPLAHGLVGANNLGLVYVVRANGIDSQDDWQRLQAIFLAVESGDAYFYNGFQLIVVVTRCEHADEHAGIRQRVNQRLQKLAEEAGVQDDFTLSVLCVDFGKEQDVCHSNGFIEQFWQALYAPIAAKPTSATDSDWARRIRHWPDSWQMQPKLAHVCAYIKQAEQFLDRCKTNNKFIAHMNNTRLLGLSEGERREKVYSAWLKQVGQWRPTFYDISDDPALRLADDHPLAAWWRSYWLAQLRRNAMPVATLAWKMERAIQQLPAAVDDLQGYFFEHVESDYRQARELFDRSFHDAMSAAGALAEASDTARVTATLLSLSLLDAKYADDYQHFHTSVIGYDHVPKP